MIRVAIQQTGMSLVWNKGNEEEENLGSNSLEREYKKMCLSH